MQLLKASRMVRSLGNGLLVLIVIGGSWAEAQTNNNEKLYEAHVVEVRKRAPIGFTILIERPFVVIGNEAPAMVRGRAENTVRWAVHRLKKDFFSRDPAEIIDIWLFKDKASYDRYTKELFHDTPTTPYGYYSAEHHALIMNIETGGGTLVHEIVHPYMRANFPECPAWFNEGMGSLFEQSSEKDGHMVGLTNWRLAGLQKSIKAGGVPAFDKLLATDDQEFYQHDAGTNYAQARYLCYYLQERGLLIQFYREFVANQKSDPSGFDTLKKILGEDDMGKFKAKWEAFVSKLTFP
jgi:hypothetical protein